MSNQSPTTAATTAAELSDDYSPETTLTIFPQPIPLLRVPIPAGPNDDPTLGPYVLAFPTPRAFTAAFKITRSKLLEQCQAGVRIGCSLTASSNCTPPWWAHLLGKKPEFKERAECEEREMAGCLVGVAVKCEKFAEEKCSGPFGSARVRKAKEEDVGFGRLLSWGSGFELSGREMGLSPGLCYGDERGYVRGGEILEGKSQVM